MLKPPTPGYSEVISLLQAFEIRTSSNAHTTSIYATFSADKIEPRQIKVAHMAIANSAMAKVRV